MSKKSIFLLGSVLLAACAEPPMGPSAGSSRRSVQPVQPPKQTCQEPRDSDPLTTVPGALAKQCRAIS